MTTAFFVRAIACLGIVALVGSLSIPPAAAQETFEPPPNPFVLDEVYAYFPSRTGVSGFIKFSTHAPQSNPALGGPPLVRIDIQIDQGLDHDEMYTLSIREKPAKNYECKHPSNFFNPTQVKLKSSAYTCNQYEDDPDACAAGDLSGKHGGFYAYERGFHASWYDNQISLVGQPNSVVDHSVFVMNSAGKPVTCANIKQPMQPNQASTSSDAPIGSSHLSLAQYMLGLVAGLSGISAIGLL